MAAYISWDECRASRSSSTTRSTIRPRRCPRCPSTWACCASLSANVFRTVTVSGPSSMNWLNVCKGTLAGPMAHQRAYAPFVRGLRRRQTRDRDERATTLQDRQRTTQRCSTHSIQHQIHVLDGAFKRSRRVIHHDVSPRERTNSRLGVEAVPMTSAPLHFANWTANRPTPPVAP